MLRGERVSFFRVECGSVWQEYRMNGVVRHVAGEASKSQSKA